jgi:hypothetical protein
MFEKDSHIQTSVKKTKKAQRAFCLNTRIFYVEIPQKTLDLILRKK